MRSLLTCASLLWMLCSQAAEPSGADLRKQAQQCRDLLKGSLVDFYLPNCLDHKNGGYHAGRSLIESSHRLEQLAAGK